MSQQSQSLYRKWRSQSFDELVGQRHVIQTLQNALQTERVAHAYIFSGPRGTGKTSTARILAKAINCLAPEGQRPCNECYMCRSISDGSSMDLIEIDAASNTQVDKVRDSIIEKVNFAPSEARRKMYILDEAHMLSNSAFNALLKTIEEPPPHVIFVLATTEIHKIPATILSRCQRLDFRRIGLPEIAEHLGWVLEQEGITAEIELLELVARQATGSMRDALSLLDQLLAHGGSHLTLAQARAALGLATAESVQTLVDYLLAHDVGSALRLVNRLLDQGTEPRQFLVDVLDHLRALLLTLAGGGRQLFNLPDDAVARLQAQMKHVTPPALVEMIRLFNQAGADLKLGLQAQLPLELAIVESVLVLQKHGIAPAPAPGDALADTDTEPVASLRPARSPQLFASFSGQADAPVGGFKPALSQEPAPLLEQDAPLAAPVAEPPVLEQDFSEEEILASLDDTLSGEEPTLTEALELVETLEDTWDETALVLVADEDEALDEAEEEVETFSFAAPPPPPALPLWEDGAFEPSISTPVQPPQERGLVLEQQIPTDGENRTLSWWHDHWPEFQRYLGQQGEDGQRASLRLKFCEPHAVDPDTLTLGFFYSIHRDKIEKPQERTVIERALQAFSGTKLRVQTVFAPKDQPMQAGKTKYEEAAEDPVVKEAMKLGGRIAEVYLPDQS
ncbi:MAG TPA: DNA polymerase III subunit gamma/tau [Ardenticatenaceae bacterium]|jgi:DNA polymerase-3 subunit gamma/tau